MSTTEISVDDRVKRLARNLERDYPRSPRDTIGGFVIAARTLDKCRAVLAGTAGEYHFDCPLDNILFSFLGITGDEFKAKAAEGLDDEEMGAWLKTAGRAPSDQERIEWNNQWRDKRISELPYNLQEFLEGYIPEVVPKGRPVYVWFDVYDLEEKRF